jgi:tetratricopeptide (TPR) repeat protein
LTGCSGRLARRLTGLAVAIAVVLVVAGCAASRLAPASYPESIRYTATADSLGLEAYLALPPELRDLRRREAVRNLLAVRDDLSLDVRLRRLYTAIGLAPDLAEAWLQLLEHARWFADDQLAQSHLASMQRALAVTADPDQRALRQRAAQTMAWLSYDRGLWLDGLAWADSTEALGGGNLVIRGLLLAGSGQFLYAGDVARRLASNDDFSSDARWIRGVAEWYRGNPELARTVVQLRPGPGFGVKSQEGPDAFIPGELRPQPGHAAECWRDLGMLEETLENWDEARANYLRSFAAVAGADGRGVMRVDARNLAGSRRELPVWLAFDRFYVTGSLSSYTSLAYARFAAARDPQTREFWASAAIDAAGVCVRRELDTPWALRIRGLIQVAAGRAAEGCADLEDTWRLLRLRHREDYATAATLGHLYLKDGRHADALPLLRTAVRLRPDTATPWADLGLTLILTGDLEGARPALDRALELDPELAVGWYNRGLLYYHARLWDAAVADLQRATELAPNDQEIARALAQALNWQRRGAEGP